MALRRCAMRADVSFDSCMSVVVRTNYIQCDGRRKRRKIRPCQDRTHNHCLKGLAVAVLECVKVDDVMCTSSHAT